MFLRRLGLYCALALSPFAFLAGCSPTAGIGSTSATPQQLISFPVPVYTTAPLPLSNAKRGAQEIGAWPTISVGGMSISAMPVTTSPTPAPFITLSKTR